MNIRPRLLVLLLMLSCSASSRAADFHDWAQRPPMGWNSWDNFATTITEAQTKEQADYMAAHLARFGWEYIVVDIQWYEPGAKSHSYRNDAVLVIDEFGRLLPAANRFPSAANGGGFTSLAAYIHGRGLKFGIHLMRGIPRQAVEKNLPVKGTSYHAQDIADRTSTCPWNPDMFGVDLSKPGAQAYYDSVFQLIASWGVDYVKVDDIARPYHTQEIEAIRRAIDRTGRPMVLSLSPGETALASAAHVGAHANLWRISDDFWDSWPSLYEQFARLKRWNPSRAPGAWPDADMLPFGVLELGKRSTAFTHDEQYTVMTLWSIARSPLMHGGDLVKTDAFTLSILTNPEVLAVDQASANNRPLFDHDNLIAWMADVPGTPDKYLAVFNARDRISLDPERAAFRSEILSRVTKKTTVPIEVDVTGATKLVLVVDDAGDGSVSDHGLWAEPRLVDAAGKETKLTDHPWVTASGGWGLVSTEKAPGGQPMSVGGKRVPYGIGAHARSVVEYDLPAGATKFRALGALDDAALQATDGGTIRFLVFTAKPGGNLDLLGLPVRVTWKELGLSGRVKVRDLWARQDLGEMSDEFAPVIPWHGGGLYRLTQTK